MHNIVSSDHGRKRAAERIRSLRDEILFIVAGAAWRTSAPLIRNALIRRVNLRAAGSRSSNVSPGDRMLEPSFAACNAWRPEPRKSEPRVLATIGRLGLEPGAIDGVAEEWMADMGHMHPDLMRAPRLQPACDEAGRAEPPLDPPMGRRASRPRSALTTAIFSRWRGWRPSGASTMPASASSAPQTSARYSRTSEPVRP